MNDISVPPQQTNPDLELAIEWGWDNPSSRILACAEEYMRASSLRSGDYLVSTGVITREAMESLLASKPAKRMTMEWVAESAPSVLPYVERYMAYSNKLPYYLSLEDLSLHPAMSDKAVVNECDEGEFVVLATDKGVPVLAFTSISAYFRRQSLGRSDREISPVTRFLRVEHTEDMARAAISRRDLVANFLNYARSEIINQVVSVDNASMWLGGSPENQSRQETRELARMLDLALQNDVTDIAIKPQADGGSTVLMRQFGDLRLMGSATMSTEVSQKAAAFLMARSGANPSGARLRIPADGHISYRSPSGEAQLRLSFIPLNHPGEMVPQISISIRLLKQTHASIILTGLNLAQKVSDDIHYAVNLTQGLIVLAGPTNTGKSTTIAGAVGEHVARFGHRKKRLSIEDPIERLVPGITQIQVPSHIPEEDRWMVLTRAIKRHDPDVLWLGEVRDDETAKACVTYAGSGHLVFSTVHATDTLVTCDVLAKMMPPDLRFQLAESMLLVVSQRLVKKLCPHCREVHPIRSEEIQLLQRYATSIGEKDVELPDEVASAKGCAKCVEGYSGLLPINESLPFTREVRDAWQVMLDRTDMDAKRLIAKSRTITLLEAALERVKALETDVASALV